MAKEIKLLIREDLVTKGGKARIEFLIYFEGKQYRVPTGKSIEPKYWIQNSELVDKRSEDSVKINSYLSERKQEFEKYKRKKEALEESASLEEMKRILKGLPLDEVKIMENKFKYSNDNKRYHTWNYHLQRKFGGKVFKVALNGGFTCPNIDGKKGVGGCIYCSSSGSGDFAGDPSHNILTQFEEVKERMHKKWHEAKYIPYFQAHTNTYAPASVLRERFEPVLKQDNVVGISIATRADCLEDDVLDYLSELNERTYLVTELGLQTVFDETGEKINRCHTYAEFLDGYKKLQDRNINVCVHLIDGLPGETTDMMLESAKAVAKLNPHCVKLHLLHVLKNTRLADMYARGEFELMTLEDYVETIVNQLEVFSEETVIQRLTGDGGRDSLVGPLWSLKKFVVLNEIDKLMVKRDTYQGVKYGE